MFLIKKINVTYFRAVYINFEIVSPNTYILSFQLAQDQEKLQELLALQDAVDEGDEAFSVSVGYHLVILVH